MRTRSLRRFAAAVPAFITVAAILSLTAFVTKERPAGRPSLVEPSWFLAEMHGDLHVRPRGEARFGVLETSEGRPIVFTLSLGGQGSDGSVTFTRINTGRLVPGTYAVGEKDDSSAERRALVVTGTANKPTGIYRGHSGYLIITSANEKVIQGRFKVHATGFLASDPEDESRPMQATGMFTTTRESMRSLSHEMSAFRWGLRFRGGTD
jgi:hypothetical protein